VPDGVTESAGITPLVSLCHLTDAFRLNREIRHGCKSLKNVADLQVAMAVENIEFFDYLPASSSRNFGCAR